MKFFRNAICNVSLVISVVPDHLLPHFFGDSTTVNNYVGRRVIVHQLRTPGALGAKTKSSILGQSRRTSHCQHPACVCKGKGYGQQGQHNFLHDPGLRGRMRFTADLQPRPIWQGPGFWRQQLGSENPAAALTYPFIGPPTLIGPGRCLAPA